MIKLKDFLKITNDSFNSIMIEYKDKVISYTDIEEIDTDIYYYGAKITNIIFEKNTNSLLIDLEE